MENVFLNPKQLEKVGFKEVDYKADLEKLASIIGFDFSSIKNDLYNVVSSFLGFGFENYKHPPRVEYFNSDNNPLYSRLDKLDKSQQIPGFDCFGFVSAVLGILSSQGKIPSIELKTNYMMIAVDVFAMAIECGNISRLTNLNQFKDGNCGILLYLNELEGWTRPGWRHAYFYFVEGDELLLIHNDKTQDGVVTNRVNTAEYIKYLNSKELYLT